jgi:hypothetical protein
MGGQIFIRGPERATFTLPGGSIGTTSVEQLVIPHYQTKLLVKQPAPSNNQQQDYKCVNISAHSAAPGSTEDTTGYWSSEAAHLLS